jgi:hypothetical protein
LQGLDGFLTHLFHKRIQDLVPVIQIATTDMYNIFRRNNILSASGHNRHPTGRAAIGKVKELSNLALALIVFLAEIANRSASYWANARNQS